MNLLEVSNKNKCKIYDRLARKLANRFKKEIRRIVKEGHTVIRMTAYLADIPSCYDDKMLYDKAMIILKKHYGDNLDISIERYGFSLENFLICGKLK